MVKELKKLNLYAGYLFFIFFIFSGIYLIANVKDVNDDYIHMSGRANHIYLLLITLLNIVYGNIHMSSSLLSLIIRLLILISGIFAAIGFFKETGSSLENRKNIPISIGLAFLSVVLFILNQKYITKKSKK